MSDAHQGNSPAPIAGADDLLNSVEEALRKAGADLAQLEALRTAQEGLPAFLEQRFADNLAALQIYYPQLQREFASRPLPPGWEFFCTANGIANLRRPTQDALYPEDPQSYCRELLLRQLQEQPLRSVNFRHDDDPLNQIHYRYLNESLSLLNAAPPAASPLALDLGAVPCCYLLGAGLGYLAGELCATLELSALLIIEPDPDLFLCSLYCFDWASLIGFFKQEGRALEFMVGASARPGVLEDQLGQFYEAHGRFLCAHTLTVVHDQNEETAQLVEAINRSFHLHYSALGFFDDNLFNISHGCQALLHRRPFVRLGLKLPDKFTAFPYFIVGNGPSLDRDIPFLRAHQDQALIIACGTALDTLYHAGIQPDFYGCTERTPQISETIRALPDQNFLNAITLLGTEVVHPLTLECFPNCLLFGKYGEAFYSLATRGLKQGRRISPCVGINPLVSNLGLATAIMLGFKETYLFGIDNGLKDKNSDLHSAYNAAYHQGGVDLREGLYEMEDLVPGNFGGVCHSTFLYVLSRDLLAQEIASIRAYDPTRHYYNCSDGALIEGAEPKRSAALDFKGRPVLDKRAFKKELFEHSISFEVSEAQCRELCRRELFSALCAQLLKLWDSTPQSRYDYLLRMLRTGELLHATADTERDFAGFALRGSVNSLFMVLQNALCRSADEGECLRLSARIASLFRHFLCDAQKLYDTLPHYAILEHLKQLHGKVGGDYPDSRAPEVKPIPKAYAEGYRDPQRVFVKRYS
ncbi:MAG: motility associated factor glycosyltransferase family protein [Succinivibrio sp.]|nr:motility associated factor glycosyltransferase family protein [Succinivibrio sp.]